MAFIFLHSSMNGDQSGSESVIFARILASITGLSFQSANFIVRKAAHFTEFLLLGACLAVNFRDLKSETNLTRTEQTSIRLLLETHPQINSWILGTLYAGMDGFQQLFVAGHGRGPSKTAAKKKAAYMAIIKLLDAAGICKEEWKENLYQ